MSDLAQVTRLWRHLLWADREVLDVLVAQLPVPAQALGEMAHVVGTEETWLSRIERRPAKLAVWPEAAAALLQTLVESVHADCSRYLARLDDAELGRQVNYNNSAGQSFSNRVEEILTHVALHGQYHRGKINLLLHQAGLEPAPVDYIAWARGVPAATEADTLGDEPGGSE